MAPEKASVHEPESAAAETQQRATVTAHVSTEKEEGPPPRRQTPGPHPRRRSTDYGSGILAGQTIIAVAVVLTLCYVARLLLETLLISMLLAFILDPVVRFLHYFKLPRAVAAFLAILLLCAALYGGLYYGYNRATDFVQTLPQYSSRIKSVLMSWEEKAKKLQKSTQNVLPEQTAEEKEEARQTVTVRQQFNWSDVISQSLGAVGEVLLMLSFMPFLVFFMLTWQDHVRAATVMLFKMENRNTAYVTLGRISAMIHSFINGNLLVGLFTSLVSIGIFWYLQLPYFYFLGFISGFLSLVPYLGVVLAILPPVVAGLGVLHGGGMLLIVLTVLLLHVFSINVLYPQLIGRRLQLNPLAVTLSLLAWGWLWGALGLILAIPLTGAMKIIFDNVDSLKPYGAWLGE